MLCAVGIYQHCFRDSNILKYLPHHFLSGILPHWVRIHLAHHLARPLFSEKSTYHSMNIVQLLRISRIKLSLGGSHFSKCHSAPLKMGDSMFLKGIAIRAVYTLRSDSLDNGRCLSGFMRLYGVAGWDEHSHPSRRSFFDKGERSAKWEETCEVDIAGKSDDECPVSSIPVPSSFDWLIRWILPARGRRI